MVRAFIEVPSFTKKWYSLGFTDDDLLKLQTLILNDPEAYKMSKIYDELMKGLNEAVAIEKGEIKGHKTIYRIEPAKEYTRTQIKKIRNATGMTQSVFAEYMGVSPKTVEAWERGTNHPTGSACRLLSILESGELEELSFVRKIDDREDACEMDVSEM